MENNFLTKEEKIDYIYETIKKQEKREFHRQIYKWIFRIFIILYLLYFYFFWLDKILNFIDTQIKEKLKIEVDSSELIKKFKEDINLKY
jgi:hypothetical protein